APHSRHSSPHDHRALHSFPTRRSSDLSNWAHRLLKSTDAKVHIFDNLSRGGVVHNLRWLQKHFGSSDRLQVTVGDVRDAALVQRAVQKATEIYHFAAQVAVTTSISDSRFDFEVNVGGTFNILEAARSS